MAGRANLVMVENGVVTVRVGNGVPDSLDRTLFWGPQTVRTRMEGYDEEDEEDDEHHWLNECVAEGGALFDLDRKVLLWWGGDNVFFDPLLRREHMRLMARNWPGWRVEWAHEGLVSFARHLGLPIEPFLSDGYDEGPMTGFEVSLTHPRMNELLFTAVQDGRTTVRRMSGNWRDLRHGPAPLEALARTPPGRFEWDPDFWPLFGGLHVDFDRKTLHHWWKDPCYAIQERMAPAWAGWTTTWLQGRFEDHLALCPPPSPLPRRPRSVYVAQVRAAVTDFAKRNARMVDAAEAKDALERLNGSGAWGWVGELIGR